MVADGVNLAVAVTAEEAVFSGHCRRTSTMGDGGEDRRRRRRTGNIFGIIEEEEEVRVRVASGDAIGSTIEAKTMVVSTVRAAMGC